MNKTYKDLTREDCERFLSEHPAMTRKYMYKHHSMYVRAMRHLGCFDELIPSQQKPYTEFTVADCEQFQREHPDLSRRQLRIYHGSYLRAMKHLGCYDRLYQPRKVLRYPDEELITHARKYKHVRDLIENEPNILQAIYYRDKEFQHEALKHMETLGDRKHRMVYVYEFPDHSAYVGITCDRERRKTDHRNDKTSAVYRHTAKTNLTPIYKQLTDYIPVEDAQRLEGEWKEHYRNNGWTILNVAPTGGIGGAKPVVVDRQKVIQLFKQGVPVKFIGPQVGASYSHIQHILIQEGLSYRGMSDIPIEVLGDDGSVIHTFPSIKAAAEHYGMLSSNIHNNIRNGWRTRGHYLRHNAEAYRAKFGKEPPECNPKKK